MYYSMVINIEMNEADKFEDMIIGKYKMESIAKNVWTSFMTCRIKRLEK